MSQDTNAMTAEVTQEELELALPYLEMNFSEIEDLPEYAVYPDGSYVFTITKCELNVETLKIGMQLSMKAVVELGNPERDGDRVIPEGSLFGANYFLKGKNPLMGLQRFKKDWNPVAAGVGAVNAKEFLDQAQNLEVMLTLKAKSRKRRDTGELIDFNEIVAAVLVGDVPQEAGSAVE